LKVRADEHVARVIVTAIRDLCISPEWEFTSVYEAGHGGGSDPYWITMFAEEGGDAILTADNDFVKLEPQVNAVFDAGIKVILLPGQWGNAKGHLQAAHIFQWWARIEATISTMKERECYRPAWNIHETGEMKKVPIDFAKAHKKRRKAKKKRR
jgi:hypothetical protein